ncbi:prosaposin [Amia ocellicauda]|uniref:prosaposin n=1 Tax=Amia ocellicauda TaxID=2972642 RepID=UPI00346472F3
MWLTLLFISTAAATPLLGQEQCVKGPPYWCQNVKTASACGAVSHCQQNVWNKPTAKSVPCDLCKEVLTVVGNLLKDNATQAEILDYLEKACQLIPDSGLSSECKEMVDNYYPILIGIITGELDDPAVACSALGLCRSLQKEMAQAEILSNEIPQLDLSQKLPPFIANVPLLLYPQNAPKEAPKNDDVCQDCEKFVKDAQDQAKSNSSYLGELIKRIESQCDLLGPGLADLCRQYVSQYAPLVFQQLMSMKPEDICSRAGFCGGSKSLPMETLVAAKLFPAIKVMPAVELKPAKKLVRVQNSPQCAVCEFIMKEIENILQGEKSEKEVVQAVEKVCSVLPASLAAQCRDLIDVYGQAVIELLVQEADPKTVCTLLGLCKDASRLYIPEMDRAQFQAGGFCEVCKLAVQYIDGMLEQNATEAEIEDAVRKVCSFLPEGVREQCDQLVQQYEPTLVQLLLQMLDPDFVCTKVGACPGALKRLLGGEQCSWGPAYWCKNMDTAARCSAVEHCRRHVWN